MTPAAARWLVSLQPDPSMEEYLDDLARRSTEGNLTESERAAYEATVSLGDCIALLQAKARKVLSGVNGQ